MKTRYTKPSPLQFDRVQSPIKQEKAPFQFKSVSKSKLSNAIVLAKRDLKFAKRKQMLNEFASENALTFDVNIKDAGDTNITKEEPKQLKRSTKQKRQQLSGSQHSGAKLDSHCRPSKQQHEIQVRDIKRLRLEVQQVFLNLQRTQDGKLDIHETRYILAVAAGGP